MSADEKSPVEESHESPVGETLEGEGFSDTEDALKDAEIKSGHGEGGEDQSSEKVTSGATEPNPKTDDSEGTP
jgi:hypothetical protein